jgi:hypothetical protein
MVKGNEWVVRGDSECHSPVFPSPAGGDSQIAWAYVSFNSPRIVPLINVLHMKTSVHGTGCSDLTAIRGQ